MDTQLKNVNIQALDTEKRNPNTNHIDRLSTLAMVELINSEDKKVAHAVEAVLPAIATAIDGTYQRLKNGGRLVYVGAGTSGRLGLLDAAECPPTFGVPQGMVVSLLAGGADAFTRAIEGAEDNEALGAKDLQDIHFCEKDVLVGIAASGRTPYVMGAMKYAQSVGGFTVSISCTKNAAIGNIAHVDIAPTPGAEVLTGSTRMKSGTAQKMVINMLSTGVMIKLGKTYGNLMVDLQATNEKLVSRTIHIVTLATGVSDTEAEAVLALCEYKAKNAIVMILAGVNYPQSIKMLADHDGKVHLAKDALYE